MDLIKTKYGYIVAEDIVSMIVPQYNDRVIEYSTVKDGVQVKGESNVFESTELAKLAMDTLAERISDDKYSGIFKPDKYIEL